MGARRHHGDHDRQCHCRHAVAAAPRHAADEHHHHRRRHGRPHRHAEVPREPASATATSRGGTRAGTTASPSTPSTSRSPTSSSPSAGGSSPTAWPSSWGRSSVRSCCRSAPGRAAGSSGSGPRSPPSWPRPPFRSCSTTPSPFTAGTSSRRWRGSTPIPSVCRWPCCSSGSSPVPSGRGGTAAGPPIVLAGCVLSHIVPGMYALGGAVILTIVELLPARWGIADSSLHTWRSDRTAVPVPWTRTLWWAGSTVGIGLLLTGLVAGPLRVGTRLLVVHGLHERGGVGPVLPRGRRLGARPGRHRSRHRRRDAEPLRHHHHGAGHRRRRWRPPSTLRAASTTSACCRCGSSPSISWPPGPSGPGA